MPPIPLRSLLIVPVLALQLWLPVAGSQARTISWSGYTWDVRPPGTHQEPGPNNWSDSRSNVQVQGSDLLLSIVKDSSGHWTSSEIDNQQHLGYGTYRWVVATDLSALDANDVLGMFTYGGSDPSNNEIDIEPSHWGALSNPTGSATVWQNANAGLSVERDFSYSAHPPYVNQFTWSPGRVDYLITDATGATLLAWAVTSGVPTPSTEVPVINHWRFHNVAPAGARTMRISSFAWAPPGQTLPPPTLSPPSGPPSSPPLGPPTAAGSSPVPEPGGGPSSNPGQPGLTCVIGPSRTSAAGARSRHDVHLHVTMQPSRFGPAQFAHGPVLRWSATGTASLELIIRRWVRGRGYVRAGALARSVRAGSGRIDLARRALGRRLGPGRYNLGLTSATRSVRCAPARLAFTVT
jgi:hypothetical protein